MITVKRNALIFCIALIGGGVAFSAGAQAPAAKTCTETRSAAELLDSTIRKWKNSELGLALQARNDKGDLLLLISPVTTVQVSTNAANYGKSRDVAYAKSFLMTQASFVQAKSEELQASTISEVMKATPSQTELKLDDPGAKDRVIRIGDKLYQLTEAMIDNALRKEGVSDDEIAKVQPSKRVDTLKARMTRTTTAKAFGQVSGVLPLQNYEAVDCSNRSAVATISVFSNKNLEFAKDVAMKRPVVADKDNAAAKPLGAMVDAEIDSKDILQNLLIRKVYDQDGYPSLISYGQWSYVNTGGSVRDRELKREAALTQSEATAKAQIAMFLTGNAQTLVQTMNSEAEEEFVTVTKETNTTESMSELIEKQYKRFAAQAQVKVTGLRVLGTWSQEYPGLPGVMIVGSVVGWSPQFADAVNKAVGSSVRQSATAETPTTAPAGAAIPAQVTGSKAKNNASDF